MSTELERTKAAKHLLDKVIGKARVHLYKPIQIAEILYRDRVEKDVDLSDLHTYRTQSRKWRDIVCMQFLGRSSTSSARYQDDVFNENAVPPLALTALGDVNRKKDGIVEAYIYRKFAERFTQMSTGLAYCNSHKRETFKLEEFIDLFWREAGLRRSIDKIYEIVVYSLFTAIVEAMDVSVELRMNPEKVEVLNEFKDFAEKVLQLTPTRTSIETRARINRVGVTNAADRGLDMWANFGLAIQIKHLSLSEELAEDIVSSVSADKIVIVCKDCDKKIILSLLSQLGWKTKVQSVITESDLVKWYEKALRGKFSSSIGNNVLKYLNNEILVEFPATDVSAFSKFIRDRGYDKLQDNLWD